MRHPTITQAEMEAHALATVQALLLLCGLLSSGIYVAADLVAALRWEGYSLTAQTVRELSAPGAPTRPFLVLLFTLYNGLLTAFGLGVWGSVDGRRLLRSAGILLVAVAAVGQATLLFFPLHLRGAERTLSDTLHASLTGVNLLFLAAAVGCGAATFGKWFRLYSIATLVLILGCGAWAGLQGAAMGAQHPTPWLGLAERIAIYASLQWVAVLALVLLRAEQGRPRESASDV